MQNKTNINLHIIDQEIYSLAVHVNAMSKLKEQSRINYQELFARLILFSTDS